jgi:hypothetical protein
MMSFLHVLLATSSLVLLASDQLDQDMLTNLPGNKILLLGTWKTQEKKAFEKALADETLLSAGFNLQDLSNATNFMFWAPKDGSFEPWLKKKYALGMERWIALDAKNRLVASGVQVPVARDLASSLARAGFVDPIKQLKDFLRSHPDHVEAREDLLKELRKYAIKNCKPGTGDLAPGDDALAWAPFAGAVQEAFKNEWQFLNLPFFRVEEDQPERRSPLMKTFFRLYLPRVEQELVKDPTRQSLWNLWAWMARSTGLGPWPKFLSALSPFTYPGGPTCPSENVAVWLVTVAKAKGDWEHVASFARAATGFYSNPAGEWNTWSPGTFTMTLAFQPIPGYPEKSAWEPLLEALARLGKDGDAKDAFTECFARFGSRSRTWAQLAATSAGRPDLAREWGTCNPVADLVGTPVEWGAPTILLWGQRNSTQFDQNDVLGWNLKPLTRIRYLEPGSAERAKWTWRPDEWVLIDGHGRFVAAGNRPLSASELQAALDGSQLNTAGRLATDFLRDHPNDPEACRVLAVETEREAARKTSDLKAPLPDAKDQEIWGSCAAAWGGFFSSDSGWKAPKKLAGYLEGLDSSASLSPMMMRLASRTLPEIESELQHRPMSTYLWGEWIRLRTISGEDHSIASLVKGLEPSPMVPPGAFPPPTVMQTWYDECVKAKRWSEAVELLKVPWERGLAEMEAKDGKAKGKSGMDAMPEPQGVGTAGLLLAEALLQDGRQDEARDILGVWREHGGSLEAFRDLMPLARDLGYGPFEESLKRDLATAGGK